MIAIAEPIDADVLRVRNEFLTRPDLHASADAVARLVDVSPRHATVILDSLVHEDFLERTADGEYVHRHYKGRSHVCVVPESPSFRESRCNPIAGLSRGENGSRRLL